MMLALPRSVVLSAVALFVAAELAVAQEAAPPAPALPLPAQLTVVLTSGRKFTGQVDRRTSDAALVLRFGRAGTMLRRQIEWDRITSAAIGEQAVALADLRTTAEGLKAPDEEAGSWGAGVGNQQEITLPPARVVSVTFDARLANWDADVEQDGLMIDVYALDRDGNLTPVSGTVEIELFAPQRRTLHHAPQSGGATFDLVERWNRTIRPEDFGSMGARLRLPFGAIHPEFNENWLAYGLVHVRLVAPGHGVFDDSRDAVRIRPWAPNRDRLELQGYPRFVPTEAVGRRS